MSDEVRQSAREIFADALELKDPAQRERYLLQACGPDARLRQVVESLLEAHAAAGEFMQPTKVASPEDLIREGPGTVIGRYKLLQQIGEGGFGLVFMAEQLEPVQRKVALKIIKAGMDTHEVIARFEAERQALALMDHPNIARVLDAGATQSGRPYFVMELVKGIRITDYCVQKSLSTGERLGLFIQICHAVQHAHQKGIIHRDLKPSNVLVTETDGEAVPKVIDFGIAKATGQRLTDKTLFTRYEQMIGTPAYMSPEQAGFGSMDIDTRTDIYALGVLLYELLTGVTPFDKETLSKAAFDEIRRMIRETEPPEPSTRLQVLGKTEGSAVSGQSSVVSGQRWKEVRGDLDWIVMKSLEKDRRRRYQTASDLAEDIERHLEHEPVLASPPTAAYRARKFIRRHEVGVAMSAAVATALALGLVVSVAGFARARRERDRAVVAEAESDKQRLRAEKESVQASKDRDLAQRHLYATRISLAQRHLDSGEIGPGISLLESLKPAAGQEDFRGFEWHHLSWRASRSHRATLPGHEAGVTTLACAPNAARLASASCDGQVKLWDLNTGVELGTLSREKACVSSVVFSRAGNLLAWGTDEGTLRIWDLLQQRERTVASEPGKQVRPIAFAQDDQVIYWGAWDADLRSGTVGCREVATGTLIGPILTNSPPFGAFALSPDDRLLAANDWVYDRVTLNPLKQTGTQRFYIRSLAFTPDGNSIFSGGNNKNVHIWDVTSGSKKAEIDPKLVGPDFFVLSPDGTVLALGHFDGSIEVLNLTTGRSRTYGHSGMLGALAFSSDSTVLASAGKPGQIHLWDIVQEQDLPVLRGDTNYTWSVAFSPDGKTVASCGDDGRISLWDVPGGTLRGTLRSTNFARGIQLAFSPDGRTLATAGLGSPPRYGGAVVLWDTATGRERTSLTAAQEEILAVAFSPDGRLLAYGGHDDNAVILYDLQKRRVQQKLLGHSNWVWSIAFSPDGKTLASTSGEAGGLVSEPGEVILWDLPEGRRRATLPGGLGCVAFSPDSKHLASYTPIGTIVVWDPQSGQLVSELRSHLRFGSSLQFTPDGKGLMGCSIRGSVVIWNLSPAMERASFAQPGHVAYALALSLDGRVMATGSKEGEVILWPTAAQP